MRNNHSRTNTSGVGRGRKGAWMRVQVRGFKIAGSRRRVRRSKSYGNSGAKLYDYDVFSRPPKYKYLCSASSSSTFPMSSIIQFQPLESKRGCLLALWRLCEASSYRHAISRAPQMPLFAATPQARHVSQSFLVAVQSFASAYLRIKYGTDTDTYYKQRPIHG